MKITNLLLPILLLTNINAQITYPNECPEIHPVANVKASQIAGVWKGKCSLFRWIHL